jgi:hypothetical protein
VILKRRQLLAEVEKGDLGVSGLVVTRAIAETPEFKN